MARLKKIFSALSLFKIFTVITALSLVLAYLSPYIHPSKVSFLQLFGLAYSIILGVHICLSIIWLFFNKKWAIAMILLLLIGGNLHFRTFSIGNGDDNKNSKEVKILSYNVHLFGRYNATNKLAQKTRHNILEYLSKSNPDVLCFQEFYHQDKPTSFPTKDTLLRLLKIKDYHERFTHKLRGRQNYGISILSKYPIVEKGAISFSELRNNFNYCIYTDIVMMDDTIRVYNVHLQSINLQENDIAVFDNDKNQSDKSGMFTVLNKVKKAYPIRVAQAEKIIKHINNSKHPVVVCGDFNDAPMSYTYNMFNKNLVDAFRNCRFGIGKTYAGKIPAGRIDYIFHSPIIGSYNFNIQSEKLSDHYAIDCKLFLK